MRSVREEGEKKKGGEQGGREIKGGRKEREEQCRRGQQTCSMQRAFSKPHHPAPLSLANRPMDAFARVGRPLDPPSLAGVAGVSSTLFSSAHSLKPLQTRYSNSPGGAQPSSKTSAGNEGPGTLDVRAGPGGFRTGSTFGGGGVFGDATLGTWRGKGPRAGKSLTVRGRDWTTGDWLKTQTALYAK